MIYPILYDSSVEPNVSENYYNMGLGALNDIKEPLVTEELNGEFSLSFSYPVESEMYKYLNRGCLVLTKSSPYSKPQLFRITQMTKPIEGIVDVYCEHKSYDLCGYTTLHFHNDPSQGTTQMFQFDNLQSLIQNIGKFTIGDPSILWTWWTDITETAEFTLHMPTSTRALIGGNDVSILNIYGGELEFDNNNIKIHSRRGTDTNVSIQYGVNMLDFIQEEYFDKCYTHIFPFWSKTLYDSTNSNPQNPKYNTITVSPAQPIALSEETTGERMNILTVDVSGLFDGDVVPNENQVSAAGLLYAAENNLGDPEFQMTVNFVDLARTSEYRDLISEKVELGDSVNVFFEKYGISTRARIIKTTYDPLKDKYTEIELGNRQDNFATTVRQQTSSQVSAVKNEISESRAQMEAAIKRASNLITNGASGGQVILHSLNNDGVPNEILILSRSDGGEPVDLEHADEIWRWNKEGLAFSADGGTTYKNIGMTKDGHIWADSMDLTHGNFEGVLSANYIQAVSLFVQHLQGQEISITGPAEPGQRGYESGYIYPGINPQGKEALELFGCNGLRLTSGGNIFIQGHSGRSGEHILIGNGGSDDYPKYGVHIGELYASNFICLSATGDNPSYGWQPPWDTVHEPREGMLYFWFRNGTYICTQTSPGQYDWVSI